MSAYPSYHHLDSVFYQNTTTNNSSIKEAPNGFMEGESIIEATCFSQLYPPNHDEIFNPSFVDAKIRESSKIASGGALSDNNELSALTTKKQSTESYVLQIDRLETEEQVTRMLTASIDKKKNRDASSLTDSSLHSKDGEVKKQRKCNGPMKDEEKKNNNKGDKKGPEEEAPKGYIHVRARRGQATDSHSLAERVRREKISERMKLLQSLVPGCDKVTGKALMLDEIINYVQSLQNQVELLSMKLAAVTPMFYNFGMDLDTFMIRTEQCSSSQPTAFGDTTATYTTSNNYPLLDTSSAPLLQQGQRPSALVQQDSDNLLWDVDDQRQKLFNQCGFNTSLCSFH